MENKRYDNIEYSENWQTTSTVTAQPSDYDDCLDRQNTQLARKSRNNSQEVKQSLPRDTQRDRKYDDYNDYDYIQDSQEYQDDERISEKEQNTKADKKPLSGTQRIIKFQLIICLIVALAFFSIKYFTPDLYLKFCEIYTNLYNSSVVITDVGNSF